MVLRAIMEDVVETTSSEINEGSAHVLLRNARCPPLQLHRNVIEVARGKSFCYISNRRTHLSTVTPDIFAAGYPCNSNSVLNQNRWKPGCDATETEHALVLPAVVSVIHQLQPRAFVLENVAGILSARGGKSEDSDKPVIQWVEAQLQDTLGQQYAWITMRLSSVPLHSDCSRRVGVYVCAHSVCVRHVLSGINQQQ